MTSIEDRCKELKSKIAAYQGNAEENGKLKAKEAVDEGKMNLIRKV